MNPVNFNDKLCKGCLLCTTVCPAGIITRSDRANPKGYFPAEVTETKQVECKRCGFCVLICPDAAIVVDQKKGSK